MLCKLVVKNANEQKNTKGYIIDNSKENEIETDIPKQKQLTSVES